MQRRVVKLQLLEMPQPKLSREQAEKEFKGRYLDRGNYDLLVTEPTYAKFPDGEVAFIYAPDALAPETIKESWEALNSLRFYSAENTRRPGLKGSKGGELVL